MSNSVLSFMVSWRKYKDLSTPFTSWTAACCDILEANARVDGDLTLATLARLSSITSEASNAFMEKQGQTEQQLNLLVLGLQTQARELQQRTPHHIASASKSTIRMESFHPQTNQLTCSKLP